MYPVGGVWGLTGSVRFRELWGSLSWYEGRDHVYREEIKRSHAT